MLVKNITYIYYNIYIIIYRYIIIYIPLWIPTLSCFTQPLCVVSTVYPRCSAPWDSAAMHGNLSAWNATCVPFHCYGILVIIQYVNIRIIGIILICFPFVFLIIGIIVIIEDEETIFLKKKKHRYYWDIPVTYIIHLYTHSWDSWDYCRGNHM